MTDPSAGERDDRADPDPRDERIDPTASDRTDPDTTVTDDASTDATPAAEAAGIDSGEPTESDGLGSPLRAVGTALGLGVLGIVFVLLSGLAVFGIGTAVGGLPLGVNVGLTLILGQYVAFGGLAVAYLSWRGFDRSGIVSYLGVRWPSLKEIGLVIGGWMLIIIMVMGISVILSIIGTEGAANQSAELAMQNPAIIPLLFAASFLVIGPSEEVLYRGIVQGRLRESLPAAPAIGIASAIFAAVHVIALTGGLQGRLTTIAVLFFPSLVFGAVYEYTENIVVPALLHGLHNAVIFTVLYVVIAYGDELEALAEGGAALLPV